MTRLQALLDRMREWEKDVFHHQYEYDMNWIKGKQSGASKPAQTRDSPIGWSSFYPGLVSLTHTRPAMTLSQRKIFDQVKTFVLENRSTSPLQQGTAQLSMPNTLPAGERVFLTRLARDLHLTLSWDEYDEEDQSLVVLRFPAALGPISDEDNEDDSQDEPDTIATVDRALRTYDETEILMESGEDNFDLREEHRSEQKMSEWKRAYYSV